MKEETIINVYVLTNEVLEFMNIDPKKSRGEGVPLPNPNSFRNPMNCVEATNNYLIKPQATIMMPLGMSRSQSLSKRK